MSADPEPSPPDTPAQTFVVKALVDAVEAAWKLADHSSVKVDDDGKVSGMKELVQSVIKELPVPGTPARHDTDGATRLRRGTDQRPAQ